MQIKYGKTSVQTVPTRPAILPSYSQVNFAPLMKQIEELNATLKTFAPVYKLGEEQGWKFEESNKSITFFRKVTLQTTPNTHDLLLPYPFQLNRIDMSFSSANAKTVSWKIYAGISPGTYTELHQETASIETSIIVQGGIEFKYKAGSKLSFEFSDFTDTDTVEISIQLDKII